MNTSEIELPSRRTRRRHAPEFRDRVVQACRQPGVSIAAVALANGLNANMVRKWVIEAETRAGKAPDSKAEMPAASSDGPASCVPLHFFPLAMHAPASATPAPADEIRIELQRGATAIKVSLPAAAAADCAAWLRELLR